VLKLSILLEIITSKKLMYLVRHPKTNSFPSCYHLPPKGAQFKGIRPPYETETHTIYPLLEDISKENIDFLTKQINKYKQPFGEGWNGKAYFVPSPFKSIKGNVVVKIHKGKAAINQKDSFKEVRALDSLESLWREKSPGASQRGLVAFKPNDGLQHIVSTYVPGGKPDIEYNPITNQALHHCIEQLIAFDQGASKLGRFLHGDIRSENLNFSATNAGFYDWEQSEIVPVKESVLLGAKRRPDHMKHHDYINQVPSHYVLFRTADTFPFQSNLKHFESGVIYRYLREYAKVGGKREGQQFFQLYLQEKAFYHRAMHAHYRKLASEVVQNDVTKDAVNLEYGKLLQKIARSELIHANLLAGEEGRTPKDILKAEFYKMLLAHYAWRSRGYRSHSDFNGKQMGRLFDRSKSYFQESISLAKSNKDVERQRYYKNCLMIIKVLDKHFNSPCSGLKVSCTGEGQVPFFYPAVRAMKLDGPRQIDFERVFCNQ
jgi:hypothetical protein